MKKIIKRVLLLVVILSVVSMIYVSNVYANQNAKDKYGLTYEDYINKSSEEIEAIKEAYNNSTIEFVTETEEKKGDNFYSSNEESNPLKDLLNMGIEELIYTPFDNLMIEVKETVESIFGGSDYNKDEQFVIGYAHEQLDSPYLDNFEEAYKNYPDVRNDFDKMILASKLCIQGTESQDEVAGAFEIIGFDINSSMSTTEEKNFIEKEIDKKKECWLLAEYIAGEDASFFSKLGNYIKVHKPNIYFYGFEGNLLVEFEQPQLLVETIPEYGSSWSVEAKPDGTLTDEQGNIYEYLFYECLTEEFYYQTESGFKLPADERVETFTKILDAYGFTEEEKEDFIEFWTVKLEENVDYIMFPQYTETTDIAYPIKVTPEPDTSIRLWFVFKEDKGQGYTEETIEPFERKGKTMFEWGGLVFD